MSVRFAEKTVALSVVIRAQKNPLFVTSVSMKATKMAIGNREMDNQELRGSTARTVSYESHYWIIRRQGFDGDGLKVV